VAAGQKGLQVVGIAPPPEAQRVNRGARAAGPGEKRSRYSLPASLETASPVGYRTRISMTSAEVAEVLPLLSMERPTRFESPKPVCEGELFEESALGILSARQSTNFRGHRQVSLGPADSQRASELLRMCSPLEAPVLDGASYTQVVFTRPYRTPFTLLLTFIGHSPLSSLLTVPLRAFRKRVFHEDDIPTIGYLQQLHLGVLADAMERAVVIASGGRRRAQILQVPFLRPNASSNRDPISELEKLCGLSAKERAAGWRIGLVAQVGQAIASERIAISESVCRKLGANLLAFRSERIQPGVNQEEKAPAPYQSRQEMDVSEELTVMAGRAAYNAFAHWTGVERELSKELLLLERVDVLTPGGKERLREIRKGLAYVTDRVVANIPLWVDLPTGKAFSRNALRGKKAFALAGQRIYIVGLPKAELSEQGISWDLSVRAVGASCARGALYAELMGVCDLPDGCDLLAGICLMAGPVNQNDIGKSFYGVKDLLQSAFPKRDPTSLLVWTLKAKTVADPIGNEEQLMNPARKGALVDLRTGPHEIVSIRRGEQISPMRSVDGKVNTERAFGDVGNFVRALGGEPIPGNEGEAWPTEWSSAGVWRV
jgi:hypothetical protein